MIPAAWLAVVFAGVWGDAKETPVIAREIVAAIRERAPLEVVDLPPAGRRALARHASGSRDVVANLHVDGLIVGELVTKGDDLTLRLVVYSGDGGLRSLDEMPLRNRALGLDDLAAIRSNLSDEVIALAAVAPSPAPAASIPPSRAPMPAVAPEVEAPAEEDAPGPATVVSQVTMDPTSDTPAGDDGFTPGPSLGLRVTALVGVSARTFLPGPSTVAGYTSSAVGTIGAAAHIKPSQRITLDALGERAVAMTTPMATSSAATTMSRWEVSGAYAREAGRFELAGHVGLGRRSFAIESADPARSPNGDYNYGIIGASIAVSLGPRVSLRGTASLEPVLSGTEPTEMAFGEAQRWGFDLGAAVELRPRAHVFARVAADLQQFAWTWTEAGARGAGGAIDRYPSATLALGAEY